MMWLRNTLPVDRMMPMKGYGVIAVILAVLIPSAALCAVGEEFNIIPQPREIKILSRKPVSMSAPEIMTKVPADWGPERYRLTVAPRGITIEAAGPQGVVWAKQTLRQLDRADGTLPHVRIDDYPEFPLRGFLYDDGRNFAGVERIKEFIDLMSFYKLNLFQWHLTDRPAWRIESKCYPRLNDGKFQRQGRDQGKFYTYDEIRDVIEYARQRGVTVMPEIDMPGHSDYFQTVFGFSMDSPEGRKVLENCLNEFCEEIPADLCPMIHIGSDEVHIAEPAGFMRWAQDIVRSYGREVFVWDPGLPADSLSVRQFWREGDPEKVEFPKGVPHVDSSMGYLNLYDPLLLPSKLFFHYPCGTGYSDFNARGGILCLWNDVKCVDKSKLKYHNGLAGGVISFAERLWRGGKEAETWLGTLLPASGTPEMERFQEFQKRMAAHKRRFRADDLSYWEPVTASEWDVELSTDSAVYHVKAWGDVIDLDALCSKEGISKEAKVTARLHRTIKSDSARTGRFKIGFEAPARSNRRSDGIAEQGRWVNYGQITVNGNVINPPVWEEPGAYRYHYPTWARPEEELPYTDEQLYWMRRPVEIGLQAGDNEVTMTLRRHFPWQVFEAAFVECQ